MKFTIDKNKDSASVTLTLLDGVARVKEIPVKKNLFVRNNPTNKDQLLEVMERICRDEKISESAFLNQFQRTQSELISQEAEELIKCYLRIKNAIKSIDIAEEIQLGNDSWHY